MLLLRDIWARRRRSEGDWFEGVVHEALVYDDPSPATGSEIYVIWFESASRTIPHIHGSDQILQVVEGEGLVVTKTERQIIRAGDWTVIPAGTWHWHGGTQSSAMCHVSIYRPGRHDWDVGWGDWERY